MNIPSDLKYTSEHEWISVDDQNIATIGITDFAQSELGDIVYVEVDTLGENLDKNTIFGTVEAVKTTSELYMPISGKIIEFNSELDEKGGDNPSLINEDPYGRGWIIKVAIQDRSELDELMDAASYGSSIS
ncbi:MAG: glycine cleavage system protein GcvH [Saprospiraceae bacterium]|jgi:glycine cleavage system H protein|nr:glycine cleavage system protein GcvH [Saprospiraceae bacterium]MBL0294363.1 glycine cleavage system protein GcvH [Saprospiraceae bacterium]